MSEPSINRTIVLTFISIDAKQSRQRSTHFASCSTTIIQPSLPHSLADHRLRSPENERLALVSRLLETMPADDSAISLDDDSLVEELDRRFADREGGMEWSELRVEH